jgi:hypothetical protein
MPAIMDIPEGVEPEAQARYAEHSHHATQPQGRRARAGFWRTMMTYVRRQRAQMLHDTAPVSYGALHRLDTPADLLVQEYPSLYIRAYAGV